MQAVEIKEGVTGGVGGRPRRITDPGGGRFTGVTGAPEPAGVGIESD
jgi:hypothetical protein